MSDHFSGPRAVAGPAGDICDLYAFPSPDKPGRLVLVLNVMPVAAPDATFSDAIICRFRLRPITIGGVGPATSFIVGAREWIIDVTFDAPQSGANGASPIQAGRCTGPDGTAVDFVVNDARGGRSDSVRVFAGLRSDPFFLDLPAFFESFTSGRLAFKAVGNNFSFGQNVLSVVVEIDCAPLVRDGGGSLYAVVGETVTTGKLPIRLERVGRPEIKNVILQWQQFDTVNRSLELRDLYNLEDPFHLGKDYRDAYRARLNANLPVFDQLDGRQDWIVNGDGVHPLTDLLLADYLVVDVAKTYAEDSYFEIERAALAGRAHTSCGGRSLNDDVMDTLYTLLINGERGPRIRDGVDQATTPASRTFPYLAPANPPSLAVPPDQSLPGAPPAHAEAAHHAH